MGKYTRIRYGCIINNPKLIELSEDVFIGDHVWLNVSEDLIKKRRNYSLKEVAILVDFTTSMLLTRLLLRKIF